MKIKSEWTPYLHELRKRELEIVFQKCPRGKIFGSALELGAGDGFQSEILAEHTNYLISTDYNQERLRKNCTKDIEYRICDAEAIDLLFEERQFDFVFSSNLLEHLPHPETALKGIHKVLKDDGVTIHIMPNRFFGISRMLLFYPNLFMTKLSDLTEADSPGEFIRAKLFNMKNRAVENPETAPVERTGNNLKTVFHKRYGYIRRLLWPTPHGISESNIKEFLAWKEKKWLKEFESAGFKVIKVAKGPVASGYGFGFDSLRTFLENIRMSSENIYIALKKNKVSRYSSFF